MPYRLIRGRSLAREVKRLFVHETTAAAKALTGPPGIDSARRVHDARKHIKKARALLGLAQRSLGKRYFRADDELRTANRALSPLADSHCVLDILAAGQRRLIFELPVEAFVAVRRQLESRASAIGKDVAAADVHARIVRLLTSLNRAVATIDLPSLNRAAMVAEIRNAHAASRKARRRAIKRPSVDRFHSWRGRVKREWHLLRLISELTGDRLRDERHQLALLDACLGELHDVHAFIRAITVDSPLSRIETSRVVRALRAHARDLSHHAHRLSSVLDERPDQLARRVSLLWGSVSQRRVSTVQAWQRSA